MQQIKCSTGNAEIPELIFGIGKGRDGWEARTSLQTVKGYKYQISGYKGRTGFYISMTQVNATEGSSMYSIDLFGATRYTLFPATVGMVTEKFVTNAVQAAAIEFGKLIPTLPTKIIYKVGDAFMAGDDILYIIEEREHEGWMVIYENKIDDGFLDNDERKTVKVKIAKLLAHHERFELGDNPEQALKLKSEFDAEVNRKHEVRKAKEEQEEQEKRERLEIFNRYKPTWAQAAIVAKFMVNDSDPMSDYFSSHSDRNIVIAWSTNTRNDFQEFRSAAALFPETEFLKDATGEFENRENYTGGSGYYLGESKYHGWNIKKVDIGYASGYSFEIAEHLQKEQPAPNTVYSSSKGSGIAVVKHNVAQGGIELHFDGKPSQSVLDDIKGNGWRWARFNKCWYKRISDSAMKLASKYGDLPESLSGNKNNDDAGAMVEANENAGVDNWAAANL